MLPCFTANRRSLVWRSCAKAAPAIARLGLFTGRAVQHSAVNRFGQDFTASADSITSADLAPCCNRALRLDDTVRDIVPHYMLMVDKVRERADDFVCIVS
jgi:hypothetical protein